MQETLVRFVGQKDPLDKGLTPVFMGFPGSSDGKEFTCNVGDLGSIPELGRSPGGRHGNLLWYSCLENPHGQRNLAGYSPQGYKESDMTEATQHACRGYGRKQSTSSKLASNHIFVSHLAGAGKVILQPHEKAWGFQDE